MLKFYCNYVNKIIVKENRIISLSQLILPTARLLFGLCICEILLNISAKSLKIQSSIILSLQHTLEYMVSNVSLRNNYYFNVSCNSLWLDNS